jgi:hypothetical protein
MNMTTAALFAATCLSASHAIAGENLVKNPDLSYSTENWETLYFTGTGKEAKPNKEVEFISHVADDGVGDSKGCLKITTKLDAGMAATPHNTGACAAISKVPGNAETPARLKLTFHAKGGQQGAWSLYVGRANGGGNKQVFPLNTDWEQFEMELTVPHDTSMIIFCPTDEKGVPVDGEVLIDEVTVEDISFAGN